MESITKCPSCSSEKFKHFLTSNDYFLSKEEFEIVECVDCGLKFTNPRPTFAGIIKYYDSAEYISHDTSNRNFITRLYTLARNIMLKKKFSIVSSFSKGETILDIGCGTGEFLELCKANGYKAYGLELNDKPRESARKEYGLDIRERIDDFSNLDFSFDCITLWHVLEHIHDLQQMINAIKKLLKPEGVLIIALPNCNSWDAVKYKRFWAAYDLPRHLYHFSKDTFMKFSEISKLKIVKILPQTLDAFYISLLSEKYQNGKSNLLKAFFRGAVSNFNARKTKKGHSSLIYILIPEIS